MDSDFQVLGFVNFEYIVVRPFTHKNLSIGSKQTYWKSVTTKVIGHRGFGANRNVSGSSNLQVVENSVLSMVTAASLGAEYVEFDVQLTRDLKPVIYHDWILSETGLDIPVNSVNLTEFKSLGTQPVPQKSRKIKTYNMHIRRSGSVSDDDLSRPKLPWIDDMDTLNHRSTSGGIRTKHHGGRADSAIKAPFATLQEVFIVCSRNHQI